MRGRTVWVAALLVTLLVAGVGSYYASASPDGLEFVAAETGFLDTAEDSPTAGSPFADYRTEGVDDERLSGGLAGVVGVGLVLLTMGALAWAVRRRGSPGGSFGDSPGDSPGDRSRAPTRGTGR